MAAKKWSELDPKYRRRLEARGYTEADHVAGVSKSAARGHARTPERPEQAGRNPKRFATYFKPQAKKNVVEFYAEYQDDEGGKRTGPVSVEVKNKKDRSTLGAYMNAVNMQIGARVPKAGRINGKPLSSFAGVKIGGYPDPAAARRTGLKDPTRYVRFTLVTSPQTLQAMVSGLGFTYESFYRYSTNG